MASSKKFVNNTDVEFSVTLYVRNGTDPSDGNASEVSFILPARSRKDKSYGTDENIYLNSIKFSWNHSGARLTKEQEATVKGSWVDDLLNTNSIISFNGVSKANMTGSN